MLPVLCLLPLFASAISLVLPGPSAYRVSVVSSVGCFGLSLLLWVLFDPLEPRYQFNYTFFWFGDYGLPLCLGVDAISLFMVLLTALLTPLCILSNSHFSQTNPLFCSLFLFMEALLISAFCCQDLIGFYAFFEGTLIPMFILIGVWGSRSRSVRAAYYLFYYTLGGSIFLLLGTVYCYSCLGTTSAHSLHAFEFSASEQLVLWPMFFLAFAVNMPVVPLHVWLPEAHVEAPTSGSVILAGVLLKLGGYGILSFLLPVFPFATEYYTPLVLVIGSLSVLYSSLTTLRQVDLNNIVAYSSVAHMNLCMLGVFSMNPQGLEGAIILMIAHGVVSGVLFLLVGALYDRHHTSLLRYYGGLTQVMPLFSFFFLFFSMSNMGLPGTPNFVGEILVVIGLFERSPSCAFIVAWGTVLCAGYSLWLHNSLNFGALKHKHIKYFVDLTAYEAGSVGLLVLISLGLGIFPNPISCLLHPPVMGLLVA